MWDSNYLLAAVEIKRGLPCSLGLAPLIFVIQLFPCLAIDSKGITFAYWQSTTVN